MLILPDSQQPAKTTYHNTAPDYRAVDLGLKQRTPHWYIRGREWATLAVSVVILTGGGGKIC